MPLYIKRPTKSPNLQTNSLDSPLLMGPCFELKQLIDGKWHSIDDPYQINTQREHQCHPLQACPFNRNTNTIQENQWYGADIAPNGPGLYDAKQVIPQGPLSIDLSNSQKALYSP